MVERQKNNSHYLSVKRMGDGRKAFAWYALRAYRRRHRTSRGIPLVEAALVSLPDKLSTPSQAAIALTRVLYLNSLIT